MFLRILGALFFLAGAPVMAETLYWQGAGTGGSTATDPSNPATWWNEAANWNPSRVPNNLDIVSIRLTDAGTVNALGTCSGQMLILGGVEGTPTLNASSGGTLQFDLAIIGSYTPASLRQDGATITIRLLRLANSRKAAYDLLSGQLNCSENLIVGGGAMALMNQYGGTTTTPSAVVGESSLTPSTYNMVGGSLLASTSLTVGYGAGTFAQTGGYVATPLLRILGGGVVRVTDGLTSVDSRINIGESRNGIMEQSGGTVRTNGVVLPGKTNSGLWLGNSWNETGEYRLSGGRLEEKGLVGLGAYGYGKFVQTGGMHLPVGDVGLGVWSTPDAGIGRGEYEMQAGSFKTSNLFVGWGGTGTFRQSGGTTSVMNTLCLSDSATASGRMELSGGTVSASILRVGHFNRGELVQTGGTALIASELTLACTENTWGTYTMQDGFVQAPLIRIGSYGQATLSQSGGLLSSSTMILGGYSTAGSGVFQITGGTSRLARFDVGVANCGYGDLRLGPAARLEVSGNLLLTNVSRLSAEAGAAVHFTGPLSMLKINTRSSDDVLGLSDLTVGYNGGNANWSSLEAAAADLGFVPVGFEGNFAMDALIVGESTATTLRVLNGYDNSATIAEAVYLNSLTLGAGSVLDLNGLNLYCRGRFLNPGGQIINGSITLPHAGDANADNAVNVGDLGVLAGDWSQAPRSWPCSDFNGDGVVNIGDLGILAGQWGWPGPLQPTMPAPEPASLVLLAAGAMGRLRRRRGG